MPTAVQEDRMTAEPELMDDDETTGGEPVDENIDAADESMPEDGAQDIDPLDEALAENAALKDRLLRAVAETENLRRRAEREKAEATLYAASNFARDMLSVADNLGRALASVDAEHRAAADPTLKALLDGVDVTQRELLNVFERHGIIRFDPKGEKFDPHFHQAMFELPSGDMAPGTVVETIQAGYRIGERVLRPAMVGVAKAMPSS
jgi:molecular chaperone GrpE